MVKTTRSARLANSIQTQGLSLLLNPTAYAWDIEETPKKLFNSPRPGGCRLGTLTSSSHLPLRRASDKTKKCLFRSRTQHLEGPTSPAFPVLYRSKGVPRELRLQRSCRPKSTFPTVPRRVGSSKAAFAIFDSRPLELPFPSAVDCFRPPLGTEAKFTTRSFHRKGFFRLSKLPNCCANSSSWDNYFCF